MDMLQIIASDMDGLLVDDTAKEKETIDKHGLGKADIVSYRLEDDMDEATVFSRRSSIA